MWYLIFIVLTGPNIAVLDHVRANSEEQCFQMRSIISKSEPIIGSHCTDDWPGTINEVPWGIKFMVEGADKQVEHYTVYGFRAWNRCMLTHMALRQEDGVFDIECFTWVKDHDAKHLK